MEKHGKPLAWYSDKASVFRINNKNATGGDGYTQFAHAMHELNIQTICANTSGRVELAHLTLQDRQVKELRLKGISFLWMQPMNLLMSLSLITTVALRKRPGMILIFTGHLKLTMARPHFSHGGNRVAFQNP